MRDWYYWRLVMLLTLTVWFYRCVVDIAGGLLYCWLWLFGLAVVWLILLRVRYIVDFYYLVWQLCGWYCWGFVMLLTFTIWFGSCVVDIAEGSLYCWPLLYGLAVVWLILLRVRYIVDLYYMVWKLCGWYCRGFVILLTFIIWFGSCVVGIAWCWLYCWSLLIGLRGAWLALLVLGYIVHLYYFGLTCVLLVLLVCGYIVDLYYLLWEMRVLVLLRVRYIVYRYYSDWEVRGWYCWLYVIFCTVTIWFDRCVVGIVGCRLYCVPLLFGLTGVWLVLLVVCYIVYRYYVVWQVRGWYCWLYVILCTVTI